VANVSRNPSQSTSFPESIRIGYKVGNLVEKNSFTIVEGVEVTCGVLLVHGLSCDLFSNHVSHDAHHGSTSVVDLSIQLACLFSGVKDISSEVTDSVVSIVLGCRQPCDLNESDECKDLGKSGIWDTEEAINSGRNIRELQVVGRRNVSIEHNVVVVDDASNDGSHRNTSVLAFHSSATFEGLRLSRDPTKRIENTKGLGGTNLELIHLQGRGGLERSKKRERKTTPETSIGETLDLQ